MSRQTYAEKLKDPRWQKKRLELFTFADFKCEHCNSADKPLNAHHPFYERGREPWEYSVNELRCLCEDCHLRWHRALHEFHKNCAVRAKSELLEKLTELLSQAQDAGRMGDFFRGIEAALARPVGKDSGDKF